ncbi:MAG: UDP-N-acetylmuramate dehydrogenase [Candidatus Daviesbacteria bacterium]|nr:UDP-N-acetylmuramate dehydrogenase [Candidatus Daviesbacteria bacterium]
MQFEDNYLLKTITTLSIGGPAKKFVIVSSEEELIEALEYAKSQQMPYLIIGGGSNLLISDDGFEGLVIKNEICDLSTSKVGPDSFEVCVKSGTLLQNLVDYTIQNGLSGLQKLTGIPGTVGGAVYGNAGAYGQSISDHIVSVDQLNKSGCAFGYRNSIFKQSKQPILEVTFQLEPGDPDILKKEAEEVLSKRAVRYPPGIKCPGSFFKNLIASEIPEEILNNIPQEKIVYGKLSAGALLEEVGAKGQSLNGIEISPIHGNLFINKDNGTAKDFYDLAKTYAEKVKEKYDITLVPEVQLINLPWDLN